MTLNDIRLSGILDLIEGVGIFYKKPINQEELSGKYKVFKFPTNNKNYEQILIKVEDNRPKWKWEIVPEELYDTPIKSLELNEDNVIEVEFE